MELVDKADVQVQAVAPEKDRSVQMSGKTNTIRDCWAERVAADGMTLFSRRGCFLTSWLPATPSFTLYSLLSLNRHNFNLWSHSEQKHCFYWQQTRFHKSKCSLSSLTRSHTFFQDFFGCVSLQSLDSFPSHFAFNGPCLLAGIYYEMFTFDCSSSLTLQRIYEEPVKLTGLDTDLSIIHWLCLT